MTSKVVMPSVKETAFNCPYCGVLTTQYWSNILSDAIASEKRIPYVPNSRTIDKIKDDREIPEDVKSGFIDFVSKMSNGEPFFEVLSSYKYINHEVHNLFVSECYNCHRIAVWVHDKLVFPSLRTGPNPNPDMPPSLTKDYEEARSIISQSPRGAAALLRLCIQKLCGELGEKGKNIDDDIASLVSKGLNPLVQQALDIVRVIGNEAVHPGVIDLDDDRETADRLFDLVNSICDQMISHPKHVKSMYEKLPPEKREAIDRRNTKASKPRGDA